MSDSCCVIPNIEAQEAGLCPSCSERGKPVNAETINALVKPELKPEGGFSDGYYCPNPLDATLYFFADGHSLTKDDLIVRVGFKESGPPQLVCYCFEHTREAIQTDFQNHGASNIEANIREQVAAGSCSCEFKNPKGKCCLGDVRAAYKELQELAKEPV